LDKLFKLLIFILTSLLISFLVYTFLIMILVNPYIEHHTWKLIDNNFKIYNKQIENNSNSIYFIGNSMIMTNINTTQIKNNLQEYDLKYDVYNLGVNFDTPLQRLIELRKITESKPELIIIGNSYCSLSNQSVYVPDDNLALMSDQVILDEEIRNFFLDEQINLIDMNEFDRVLYKRKFIISALNRILGIKIGGRTTFINESLSLHEKMILVHNPYDAFLAPVFPEDNIQKKAFRYFFKEIKRLGIPIIYINMPLDPLRSKTIPEDTRINHNNFIKSTDIIYYDIEYEYSSEEFNDLVHLNKYGKARFSDMMTDIIIELEKSGAI